MDQAQSALPGGAYSPTATANMTSRTKNILGVKEEYDAYDLVLEYLLSTGHADTLLEAQYVMMQMSAEHIQSIVEDVYMGPPIKTETKPGVEKRKPETKPTESDPIILDRQGRNPDRSVKKPFPGPISVANNKS